MTLERRRRALQLLDEALDCTAQERQAFLAEACGGDKALRREVESLLETDADGGILREPAFSVHAEDAAIGRQIDNYKLIRLLDRGGMGTVYLAEREDFEKRVALKLIRRGLDLDDVLVRRFHNERQILARLEHPNIARLLDGGTTADRLPYFVMEYVEGEPIDRYCDSRKLSIDERLEIFRRVCSAVHFAHQNLVIHRDLKPGNVLITADGTPKLLDFGIAKLLDDGLAALSVDTETGLALMTPRYASPEQIRLEPITTASDVYALGVMLYEVLTGLDPYNVDTTRRDEIARAICDVEPDKPSTAVRRRGERMADPRHLRRRLSGDLDSIVLKAMRKEPHERYDSAEQLSEDVRRHLAGLPVAARVGSFGYYVVKFVRRNKFSLAAAAAFLLLISVSTALWRQNIRERELKERESQGAQRALDFVENLFRRGPDEEAGRENFTVLNLLERAAARLEEEEDAPKLQIGVGGALGEGFRSLGAYDESKKLMERSLRFAEEEYEGDHAEVAKRISNLGVLLTDLQDYEGAESRFREAVDMLTRLGVEPSELVRIKSNLATNLLYQNELNEVEELYRDVLATRLDSYDPDHIYVAVSRRNLGALWYAKGDYEKAEEELRMALKIHRHRLPPEHTSTASVLNLLGNVLAGRGEKGEAEGFYEQAEAFYDEAQGLYQEALDIRQRRLPEDHDDVATTKANLAALLLARGSPEDAQALLTEALASFHASQFDGWQVAEAEGVQGMVLMELGSYEEAESFLVESYEKLRKDRGARNFRTLKARERVLDLYKAWGRLGTRDQFLAMTGSASEADQQGEAKEN